jgi:hypothetical protein
MNGAERADLAALPAIPSRAPRGGAMRRRCADRLKIQDAFTEAIAFRLAARKDTRILGGQIARIRAALGRLAEQPALDGAGYLQFALGHIQAFRNWRPEDKTERAKSELYTGRLDAEIVERCLKGLEGVHHGPPSLPQLHACLQGIWRGILDQSAPLTRKDLDEVVDGKNASARAIRLVYLKCSGGKADRMGTGRDDFRKKLAEVKLKLYAYL